MTDKVFHSLEEFECEMIPKAWERVKRAEETPEEAGKRLAEEALKALEDFMRKLDKQSSM